MHHTALMSSSDQNLWPFSNFLTGANIGKPHGDKVTGRGWGCMECSMSWTVHATWGWALSCNMMTPLMRMLGRFTMEAVQRILRIPQQHCVMVMSGSLNASIKGLYICVGQRCQGCGDAEISATAKGVLSDGNPMTCVSKGYLPQHPVGLFLTASCQ